MSQAITVEIKNWERFNGRPDVKHPSWFRLEHSICDDPDFYSFTDGEFRAWIYILCQASKKNCGRVTLNFEHAERAAGLVKRHLDGAIKKLQEVGILLANVTDTNAGVTLAGATDRQTDKTVGAELAKASPPPTPDSFVLKEIRDPFTDPTLASVSKEVQDGWLATFGDAAWIRLELKKAVNYTRANPRKTPKSRRGWSSFLTGWLNRGWEWKRKGEPTNGRRPNTTPVDITAL